MALNLTKVCTVRIFMLMISASIAFTVFTFGITAAGINTNAEAIQIVSDENTRAIQIVSDANTESIQIVNEDIKQILKDTSYIRGIIENDKGR